MNRAYKDPVKIPIIKKRLIVEPVFPFSSSGT